MNETKSYTFVLDIEPMGAVRTTQKGQHTDRAKTYHSWMNKVRWIWKKLVLDNNLNPDFSITESIDSITFAMSIPDPGKGTKKQQEERLSLIGNPHKKKPDIDNLFKALTDAICYEKDDSHIHTVGMMRKIYAPFNKGYITISFSLP